MATGVAAWSQTAATNASADTNVNWAEGMAPSQVNDSARAMMASVAKYRDDLAGSLTTGGTSTAYTISTNQGFASLSALSGQVLCVRFNATCGASPTLAIDSLTAQPIQIDSSSAVAKGSLRKNAIHYLTYDNAIPGFIVHNGHALIAPGRIMEIAYSTADPGWLLCDGSAVSRTTYADLFANIGTTWGSGDGSTTFNVPDRRGYAGVGVDVNATRLFNMTLLGNTSGARTTTLTTGQIPQFSFTPTGSVSSSVSGGVDGGTSVRAATNLGSGTDVSVPIGGAGITVSSSFTGDSTSIGSASPSTVSLVQPSIAMNYMIKT